MNKKYPWEQYPHIWKTKTKFMTYLRGCLRKAWNNNPIKNHYKNSRKKQIDNPNLNGKKQQVFGFECELCHKDFPMKEAQVDHIVGENTLKEPEDIQRFTENLLFVDDDDLMLVCKKCHGIKTYMERYGIASFEEAAIQKDVIQFSHLSIEEQKDRLGVETKTTKKELKQMYLDLRSSYEL